MTARFDFYSYFKNLPIKYFFKPVSNVDLFKDGKTYLDW